MIFHTVLVTHTGSISMSYPGLVASPLHWPWMEWRVQGGEIAEAHVDARMGFKFLVKWAGEKRRRALRGTTRGRS